MKTRCASSSRCSAASAAARPSTAHCHAEAVRGQLAGAQGPRIPGEGRVLVIDGGGSLRRALVGDQLAALGVKNGWAGIVVYGCIRDSRAIGEMDIGVFALDTHPMKTRKKNVGDADMPVTFGGVTFNPGEWLYADEDGVIVSESPLH
jgi:regulator of ribonuclease activity A